MILNFIKKLRIKWRLNLLLLIWVVGFISFGIFAVNKIGSLNDRIDKLARHPLTVSNNALAASEDIIRMHRAMKDYVIATTEIDANNSLKIVDEIEADAYDRIQLIDERIIGARGKKLVSAAEKTFTQWRPIRQRVIGYVKDHDMAAARAVTKEEGAFHVKKLERQFKDLKDYALNRADAYLDLAKNDYSNSILTLVLLFLVLAGIGLWLSVLITSSIINPVAQMQKQVSPLVQSSANEERMALSHPIFGDEIKRTERVIQTLLKRLEKTSKFLRSIGEGNLDEKFELIGDDDFLGQSLENMREKLVEVNRQDSIRSWTAEGVAKFAEILRASQDNVENLATTVIQGLVEYLDCKLGGFFVVETNVKQNTKIRLAATYAWDRVTYVNKELVPGEGLVGQCYLEGKTMYLKDVPEGYIKITTGMGESNPRAILLVPAVHGDQIIGIVELASFRELEPHEIQFAEEVADSIALTVSTVQSNSKTQKLLVESRSVNEQVAAQEEELRQNAEELQATQEEMIRQNKEQEDRIRELEALVKDAGIES